jgi:hypothetical protein
MLRKKGGEATKEEEEQAIGGNIFLQTRAKRVDQPKG